MAGNSVGLFFGAFTVTCVLPLLLLCFRWYRRKYLDQSTLFELKLGESAKISVKKRAYYFDNDVEETDVALQHLQEGLDRVRSTSRSNINNNESDPPLSSLDHFKTALKKGHAYWGIEDLLLPGGHVSSWLSLPPGLFEDYLFYCCNLIQPLPFLFADDDSSFSFLTDYVVYCNAQVFALLIYVFSYKQGPVTADLVTVLMFPIIMILEFWLSRMIGCPCLKDGIKRNGRSTGISDADFAVDEEEDNSDKFTTWSVRVLRGLGGLLAVPLIILLIIILILIADISADVPGFKYVLADFLWNGVILAFVLKMLLAMLQYLWFVSPLHVNIFGVNFLKINYWMELQFVHQDFQDLDDLSPDSVRAMLRLKRQELVTRSEFCHLNCYCLRYMGLPTDTHHRCDICHLSCYCSRCINSISNFLTGHGDKNRVSRHFSAAKRDEMELMPPSSTDSPIGRGDRNGYNPPVVADELSAIV